MLKIKSIYKINLKADLIQRKKWAEMKQTKRSSSNGNSKKNKYIKRWSSTSEICGMISNNMKDSVAYLAWNWISRRKGEEQSREIVWRDNDQKQFLKLIKGFNPKIYEVQWNAKENKKKTPRHIIVKLLKNLRKKENLKSIQRKMHISYTGKHQ